MDSLQFQKAEYADPRPKCLQCQSAIENTYYHLAGRTICPRCAEITRAAQGRPANTAVMRGMLYGLGAAAACSAGYAVITMTTGIQLALIAILVGYLVGRAVRIGSGGLGGLRCQIIAVVLTYLAITTSYVPLIIQAIRQQAKTEAAKHGPAPIPPAPRASPGTLVIAVALVTGI